MIPDLPFTEDEIKNTIWQVPGEKAPGPDGFIGTFYKVCWSIIREDLIAATQCFYQLRARPLEHLNGAILSSSLRVTWLITQVTTGRSA
jgi:hypothetical protein